MIYLKNICKTFIDDNKKEVHAVNDVSLTINDGDIFGIIGFSGAGKSTLVRCINLLERPTSGTVEVDGKDLTKLSEKELRESRKKIGMIFQHFNLFPSRTIFGNVAFPLQGSGLSEEEIAAKVRNLLELVGISEKEKMLTQASYPVDRSRELPLRELLQMILISYYVMRLQVLLTLRQQRLFLIFLRILIRSLELLLLLSLMRWPLLRKSVTR